MKNTANNLQKLERILTESGYVLRYERGTFQSGYCILEQRKVVVLNKFLTTEGRIGTLIELIPQVAVNADLLTSESQQLLASLQKEASIDENS